jgi:hypothetical protein
VPEQLLICAENLLNQVQFPNHTITASSEASGYSVDRLANGRRHAGDRFEPNNTNTDVTITARCDVIRAANFAAIDRASNHLGYRYQWLASDDNFTSSRTLADVNTIPLVVGGRPSEAYGCVTDEGAWLKTVTVDAHNDWRFTSKAMGASLKPQITGLWLGRAWTPSEHLVRFPLDDRGFALDYEATVSPYGWKGRGQVRRPRSGVLRLGFPSQADEGMYAYHIESLALRGFPFWLCWQTDRAPWRAILASIPEGTVIRAPVDPSWHSIYRSVEIPFIEEQPA